ncbi:Fusaric acid resistance protein-like-domain-containing protein [Lineolata rhizophorae]|uniref:Fusaric acid resistance protein-like-domain-containing protein n=1 Tax=Lineolata rhizophorae TaxID=578093 RepID=A0A6A6NUR4_9PEZI|nr:Fusaric acid resistance protein-like-domain-containing protein [Lineolata rhizophorae]
MSPAAGTSSSDGAGSPAARRFLRRGLREATLVLPRTGERVRRTFTLRDDGPSNTNTQTDGPGGGAAAAPSTSDSERAPLLIRRSRYVRRASRGALGPRDRSHTAVFLSNARVLLLRLWAFATSQTGQGILKCSLAYLLGSLATFVPAVAGWLGRQDGKHMVATITVYFHPYRSAGSMVEATVDAALAFLYAAGVSFASMGIATACAGHGEGSRVAGQVIVLIVFCGAGLGFVAWLKQRLGSPLVNVACSLTSLAIITVLTKEGAVQAGTISVDKVVQVLKMLVLGILATTLVSFTLQPISARRQLRRDFAQATDTLADMLAMITRSFLSGTEEELDHPHFVQATEGNKSVMAKMGKDLREAKFEHLLLGEEKEWVLEEKLVRCLEQLTENIGGLRSAAATQFTLIRKTTTTVETAAMGQAQSQHGNGTPAAPQQSAFASPRSPGMHSPQFMQLEERFSALGAIDELPEEEEREEDPRDRGDAGGGQDERVPSLPGAGGGGGGGGQRRPSVEHVLMNASTPADIFAIFIAHLGPPMKSLAYTLKQMLDELPQSPQADPSAIAINCNFRASLVDAIDLFTRARHEALAMLYETKLLTLDKSVEVAADYEEVAASCGYFSSSLQDFAEDMLVYLDTLEELKGEVEARGLLGRRWNWLLWWRRGKKGEGYIDVPELTEATAEQGLSQQIPSPSHAQPPNRHDPEKPRQHQTLNHRLWRALAFLRRDDLRFAVKVGVGAILYAMWSFISATRPFYSHWRGEWGLLSYMLVCSMTIGASNTTGYQRFLGTCLGALFAIVAWVLADENAVVLAFLGWLVSVGCFYIIVGLGKGPMGRFILLTYNLSALYAYSLSTKADNEDDDDEGGIAPEIWEIVLHRVVAVMVGCLWGIVITRLIWPISARRKFKDGICVLWLRMSLIWRRDPLGMLLPPGDQVLGLPPHPLAPPAATNGSAAAAGANGPSPSAGGGGGGTADLPPPMPPPRRPSSGALPSSSALPPWAAPYMDIRESLELRRFLTRLEGLRRAAVSEFELRGPFPDRTMRKILQTTGHMLDAFYAMNVVISKDLKASEGERELLKWTAEERRQLSSRISHLFSVLASSMKLEYPLNDALPNIEHTRDRLLARIFDFRQHGPGREKTTEEDYELLYAYALVTGQLAQGIVSLCGDVEQLYGVLNEENLKLE